MQREGGMNDGLHHEVIRIHPPAFSRQLRTELLHKQQRHGKGSMGSGEILFCIHCIIFLRKRNQFLSNWHRLLQTQFAEEG